MERPQSKRTRFAETGNIQCSLISAEETSQIFVRSRFSAGLALIRGETHFAASETYAAEIQDQEPWEIMLVSTTTPSS